jgi:hypothetical protein
VIKDTHLHWILDLAIIDPVSLGWLLPRFNGQHTNALPIPGFELSDYVLLLDSVIEEGLIQFSSGDQNLTSTDAKTAVAEYASGFQRPQNRPNERVFLQITEQGGEAWERIAEPKWDKFFNFQLSYHSSELDDLRISSVLASKNRDAVVAYLGWYERLENVDVQWQTLRVETHSSYAATYWKTLNDVYEAAFDGIRRPIERDVPTLVNDWKLSLGKWRLRPWERHDWPGAPLVG